MTKVTVHPSNKVAEYATKIVQDLADADFEDHEIVLCIEIARSIIQDWAKDEGFAYNFHKLIPQ